MNDAPKDEQPTDAGDQLDRVIAAHDGDVLAALTAALVANRTLEHELAGTKAAVSFGYRRGR
jgi:hypothetical protein